VGCKINFQKTFIAAIIAVCLIPFAGTLIFGGSPPPANEIAVLPPELLKEGGGVNNEFFSEFTDYAEKRFWPRRELITLNSALMVNVFGISPIKDVILGKNGWLFYNASTDDFLRRNILSDSQIDEAARKLKNIEEYCARNGGKFVCVIAPDKNSVYPEYMPYLGEKHNERGNADRLLEKLEFYAVTHVNLFEVFANEKPRRGLYHKLDTHWNNMGAAIAADEILRAAGRGATNFADAPYEKTRDFKGDLYAMLYPSGRGLDENIRFADFRNVNFSYE
jgi:hypothetical protein